MNLMIEHVGRAGPTTCTNVVMNATSSLCFWPWRDPTTALWSLGAHFTQGTILIVILVSSVSAKSRTHQFAVGGFLGNSKGMVWRMKASRIWTFINSV